MAEPPEKGVQATPEPATLYWKSQPVIISPPSAKSPDGATRTVIALLLPELYIGDAGRSGGNDLKVRMFSLIPLYGPHPIKLCARTRKW